MLHVQGLLQDTPAILLVGGGEGMGKLQATVQQLDLKLQGKAQVRGQQQLLNGSSAQLTSVTLCAPDYPAHPPGTAWFLHQLLRHRVGAQQRKRHS
jgi:uncharacterized protein (DUF934 family)